MKTVSVTSLHAFGAKAFFDVGFNDEPKIRVNEVAANETEGLEKIIQIPGEYLISGNRNIFLIFSVAML